VHLPRAFTLYGAIMILVALLGAACTATPGAPTPAGPTPAAPTPAETDDGQETAQPTEPQQTGTVRIGRGSLSIAYVPSEMAFERLTEMGYDLEITEFISTSTQVQAAAEGLSDISTITAAANVPALDAGLDFTFFLSRNLNEFVLVARSDLTTCESLDGLRVAVHSQTDITGLLTSNWLEENCPDANPDVQIVEGSENRLAGLLQDQLDASPLDIQDTQLLLAERPDDFHVLANWVTEFPLLGGVYAAPPDWLAENEEFVKDFIRVHLDVWDEIYANPDLLVEEAVARLPQADPEILEAVAMEYLEFEVLPPDGDLSEELVNQTLSFFAEAGGFENVGGFDEHANRSYLDEVLSE